MRKRSESTRQAILAAARQLFLRLGYTAAGVSAIADQAQVTKQTLYRYFPGKRALFIGVIEAALIASSPDTFSEVVASVAELRDALVAMATYINSVISDPDYIQLLRVVIAETITHPDLGTLFKQGITAQSLELTTVLFRSSNKAGVTAFKQPENAARLFVGGFAMRILLDGLLAQAPYGGVKELSKQELQLYVDDFMLRTA